MEEICVDILLPQQFTIPGINFKREVLNLDGQLYPQDLVQARYEYFTLTYGPLPNFALTQLPPELQKRDWQCISIDYDDEQVPFPVENSKAVYSNDTFFNLLRKVTDYDGEWILVFTTGCDEPEQAVSGNWIVAEEKVRESLANNNSFIMYYNGNRDTLI